MTDTSKQHLNELIAQLLTLGEDKFELDFWVRIYDSMSTEEKSELIDNLQAELNSLKQKQRK